jgi:hypothetical protein
VVLVSAGAWSELKIRGRSPSGLGLAAVCSVAARQLRQPKIKCQFCSWYGTPSWGTALFQGLSATHLTAPGADAVPDAAAYMFAPSSALSAPAGRGAQYCVRQGDRISIEANSTNRRNGFHADVPSEPSGGADSFAY